MSMADTEELARLLVEVQTQLAYQEDTITALNEALADQQQEILVLRRQMNRPRSRTPAAVLPMKNPRITERSRSKQT
jgi:SlyX protein